MRGIQFPVPKCKNKYGKFEKQNNISIDVIGYSEKTFFPVYVTKLKESNRFIIVDKRGTTPLLLHTTFGQITSPYETAREKLSVL